MTISHFYALDYVPSFNAGELQNFFDDFQNILLFFLKHLLSIYAQMRDPSVLVISELIQMNISMVQEDKKRISSG